MSKAWTARKVRTELTANVKEVIYEIRCPVQETKALEKLMEVFFNLKEEDQQ